MKTLLLLRHAKSDWSAGLADHDRPLNARGEATAERMGRYLVEEGLKPDLILCSTAMRTRETLNHILDAYPKAPPVRYEKSLYLATPEQMLKIIRSCPNNVSSLMVIAHNPGSHLLAHSLAAAESKRARAELAEKFPTGALAILTFPGIWNDITPGSGKLIRFIKPKSLADI